jgi:hypothetical protein
MGTPGIAGENRQEFVSYSNALAARLVTSSGSLSVKKL